MLKLVIYGLACWRLTRILTREEGPNRIFVKMREATGLSHNDSGEVDGWPTDTIWPFHCNACTSIYVSALLLILPYWFSRLLALSMIAITSEDILVLVNKMTDTFSFALDSDSS